MPALHLPLNYLVVMVAVAVAGLVAAYAVLLRHERSLAAYGVLLVGLSAGAFLLAEALSPPAG